MENGPMHAMRLYRYPIAVAGVAMGIGFSVVASDAQQQKSGEGAVELANPAAVFCVDQGGRFEIREADAGSRGFCILPDCTAVDAWTYFREQSQPEVK